MRGAGVQVLDGRALGVQLIGGDHHCRQVQGVQQRREPADLAGLAVHIDLAEDDPGVVVDDGQQMPGTALRPAGPGSAHRLAVHRDRTPSSRRE